MEIFKKLREGNIADMEQRVVLVPDNPKYHGELAAHYTQQGRYIKAINEYKLAIGLDPHNLEYRRLLKDAYIKAGRYREAEEQQEIIQSLDAKRQQTPTP